MERPTIVERIRAGFERIQILLFLAFVAVPLLIMAVGQQHVPDTIEGEKRERVPLPEISLRLDSVRSFPDRFEAFLEDRFGLRDRLIRWYSRFNWNVLGMSPTPKVVPGSGQWLFFDGDPETDDAMPYDQRGEPFTRVHGGRIDIGAVEWQPNPLPGDYNFNGTVDAADYSVWRDTLGSTTDLRADGSGNGLVDEDDYTVWKTNFGHTLGSGSGAVYALGATAGLSSSALESLGQGQTSCPWHPRKAATLG